MDLIYHEIYIYIYIKLSGGICFRFDENFDKKNLHRPVILVLKLKQIASEKFSEESATRFSYSLDTSSCKMISNEFGLHVLTTLVTIPTT